MNILITGGTGLIGRALCRKLLESDHRITVLSRRPDQVPDICGTGVIGQPNLDHWEGTSYDAVINLAGEPLVGKRWTANRKEAIWESRVTLTEGLVRQAAKAPAPPAVIISGSAIGYYGNRDDEWVDESSNAGSDFGATLCHSWEQSVQSIASAETRVCTIRTGLVLSDQGGMLGQMKLPFKLGLGGRIGSGRQWMSWIHIEDQIATMLHMLSNAQYQGAYNLVAPNPVTNQAFTQTLARVLNRPAIFPAPAALLKLGLGESAELLLGGQRVKPQRLLDHGFQFKYPDLEAALQSLLR